MRLTFLGTGTSFGVPQVGCQCRTCTSTDARDKRTRTAALIESGGRRLLIDTPPELRLQLVAAGVGSLDAVLFTHGHADHVHGIDDLRAISVKQPGGLAAYGPGETLANLAVRFPYIFDPAIVAQPGTTKPELKAYPLEAGRETEIAGMRVRALPLPHGSSEVFGYRIGPIAYLTDAKTIPDDVRAQLGDLDVLVLNGLLSRPHPLHLSIPEAVAAAQAIGAARTFLTHLTHELTHAELAARLPAGIAPAYDGLAIEVGAV
ncbi:MAG TPA: MBL fold metallo-hydrolase [Gemmatimonadales bacterium]|nr:MBL fold metallo-hydrolase [Gemmatimonadales bacterium]